MKKIKMNWGTGIAVAIIIFMIMTIVMTITFMNQKVDLVTDNYYEKSQVYQDQIDTKARTDALTDKVHINYSDNSINIVFPESVYTKLNKGKLFFYRPSDSQKDFSIPIQLDTEGRQTLNASRIEKGLWKLEISWTMNKLDYQSEETIIIY